MMRRRSRREATGVMMGAVAALMTVLPIHSDAGLARASGSFAVDVYKELMVVHPSVVDPFLNGGRSHNGGPETSGGPWSLRFLLKFLVNNQSEANRHVFYASFFEQWLDLQTADNGARIPARNPALVRELMLDQFSVVDATGKRTFEMWKLPFELMAIVYRPDLRAADGSDAGELRFVYKLLGPTGDDVQFTLNMEYKIKTTYFDARTWAHNFNRLGALEVGSEEYLTLLERLTWWSTVPYFTDPPRLGQIRTNELAFDPTGVWEMREFVQKRPSYMKTHVAASSVENTPAASFNGTTALSDFIAESPVLSEPGTAFMNFKLPETLGSTPFLDGASRAGIAWTVPGETAEQRSVGVDNLGLLTCNGCHQDNKSIPGDMDFYHVKPDVSPGQDGRPRLSLFLTSPDPDPLKAESRPGELKRRKDDLEALLAEPWTPNWISFP